MTPNLYPKLIEKMQEYRGSLIDLGGMLREAQENSIWMSEIGEGINTWYEFLAQPEIGLPVSEANFLVKLAGMAELIGANDITKVPVPTLKYMVKHGGDIHDAQLLTTKDFKRKYFEDRHSGASPSFKYVVMKINEDGTMDKVYGEELEVAKKELDG